MSERPPGTRGTGTAPAAGYAHAHEAPYEPPHESVEFDREIQYHQLIWMGVGLLVIAVVSAVLVFFMLKGFVSWRATSAGPPPLVAPAPAAAAPQLLARPEGELKLEGLHTMGEHDLMVRIVGRVADGEYTASWKATGVDGSASEGQWKFVVKRAAG